MSKQHLMVFVDQDGMHHATVETLPGQVSDFRDAQGRHMRQVLCVPIEQVLAAPDLLAACEKLLGCVDEIHPPTGAFWSGSAIQESARAAIAKAGGGQ